MPDRFRHFNIRCFGIPLIAIALNSCALGGQSQPVVTQCILPADQAGSLSGRWTVQPIPIAFHQGDFSGSEINAMVSAAGAWNTFYNASLGAAQMFNVSATSTTTASKPTVNCSSSLLSGNQFAGPVVIYKDAQWPYTNIPNAIALTTFCVSSAKPLPSMYTAYTEINYQNFFVNGMVPDIQSIVTHEMGHILGLNHSCNVPNTVGCSSSIDSSYLSAVMYPSFGFSNSGAGEIRDALNSNDEGRANCLYGDLYGKNTQ